MPTYNKAPKKTKSLANVHQEAMIRFDDIIDGAEEVREMCLSDRRFYAVPGAQWEGKHYKQFKNKPRMQIDKVGLGVLRIINEYRNNRIAVDFVAAGEDEATESLASTCDGLLRADEQDSCADEAYDNAFEEGVAGGMGAWRLTSEYEDDEDEESEYQRIRIEPIFDADSSVFFDPQAKRYDKSDANYCFVITGMTHEAYEDEYGENPSTFEKDISDTEYDWMTDNIVYVSEYYICKYEKTKIRIYKMLDGSTKNLHPDDEDFEDQEQELLAFGAEFEKQRTIKKKRVYKYIIDGARVIEDCGYIAGCHIPIVPYYGRRSYVDSIERIQGHVRPARDPQMLKNMQTSKLAELAAKSPDQKPIFTPAQVKGHELRWSKDNLKNYPYMLINPVMDPSGNQQPLGPLGSVVPPQIPPALAALMQQTDLDIREILGNPQEGDKMVSNIARDTVELIQARLDMQSYIYVSNMARSLRRSGQIWYSMAQELYVEDNRQMETVGVKGDRGTAILNRPVLDENGSPVSENDLSSKKFKIIVDIGPSSTTKKEATIKNLAYLSSLTTDPETKQVLGMLAMINMEGEGMSEVRGYFRDKLIKMGVINPTDEEKKRISEELKNQQPSPQDQYLQAAAANEQAKSVKAQADTIKTQADADKARAQTVKTLAEVDKMEGDQALDVIEKLGPRVSPPDIPGSNVQE